MIVQRVKRKLRRMLGIKPSRPSILMYHRVVSLKHDPWALAVSPEHFEEQVRYIRRYRTPMLVTDMVEHLRRGTLPTNAIAITFDDAYRDNLIHARPVLMRYGVPATVFVPTGFIGKETPFWWDELASMILECPHAERLVQACGGEEVELAWGAMEAADADLSWRGWDPPQSQRQASYVGLWSRMQRTTIEERARVLEELRTVLHAHVDPLGVPMSAPELETLTKGGLIRVGGHTVNHASLSDIALAESRWEIREGLRQCQTYSPDPVDGFAYPYGNMTPEVCQEVSAAGYSWACSTESSFLDSGTPDFFMLPRLTVTDIVGRDFALLLAGV